LCSLASQLRFFFLKYMQYWNKILTEIEMSSHFCFCNCYWNTFHKWNDCFLHVIANEDKILWLWLVYIVVHAVVHRWWMLKDYIVAVVNIIFAWINQTSSLPYLQNCRDCSSWCVSVAHLSDSLLWSCNAGVYQSINVKQCTC